MLNRADRLDADDLTDPEVLLAGRRLVDDDLACLGPGPTDERQRIERRIAPGDAEAEIRRSAVDDRLAVLPDQLGLAVDAAVGLADVGERSHLLEQ